MKGSQFVRSSSPDNLIPTTVVEVNYPSFIMAAYSSTVVSDAINDAGWVGYTKGVTIAVGDRCYGCGAFVTSRKCLVLWDCLSVL
jgi:hypothetical protein